MESPLWHELLQILIINKIMKPTNQTNEWMKKNPKKQTYYHITTIPQPSLNCFKENTGFKLTHVCWYARSKVEVEGKAPAKILDNDDEPQEVGGEGNAGKEGEQGAGVEHQGTTAVPIAAVRSQNLTSRSQELRFGAHKLSPGPKIPGRSNCCWRKIFERWRLISSCTFELIKSAGELFKCRGPTRTARHLPGENNQSSNVAHDQISNINQTWIPHKVWGGTVLLHGFPPSNLLVFPHSETNSRKAAKVSSHEVHGMNLASREM